MIDKRLLREVKGNKIYMIMMVANGILTFATSFFIALFIASIVNNVFLLKHPYTNEITYFILLLITMLFKFIYQLAFEAYFRKTALSVKDRLRKAVFSSILRLGPLHVQSGKIGSNMSNVGEAADYLDSYYYEYIPHFFSMVISIPLILIPVFISDKLAFGIMLITAPLLPLFLSLIGMASKSFNEVRLKSLKQLSSVFIDTLNGIKTLKLFGKSKSQAGKIYESSEGFRKTTMEVLRVSFLSAFVLELAATISTAIIAVSLGLRLLYGQMEFFPAFLILLLAPEYYQPIRQFGAKFHTSLNAKAAANSIYTIINLADSMATNLTLGDEIKSNVSLTEINIDNLENNSLFLNNNLNQKVADENTEKKSFAETPNTNENHTSLYHKTSISVSLDNVSFRYEGSNTYALKNITLQFPANTTNAITGKSGSGKSTLTYLLLGLLKPDEGQILFSIDNKSADSNKLENKDIGFEIISRAESVGEKDINPIIAYVPQKPFIFKGSLRENILMGLTGVSESELESAIKGASLEELLSCLPQGLDTLLQSEGITISVGEAQRIAVARALVRNASFLIVDEATSAQDEENQEILMETIKKLKSIMTVLVIAHRLETIRDFDQIIQLNNGEIN